MIKTWILRSMSVKNSPIFYEYLKYGKLSSANFQTKKRRGEVAMVLESGDSIWMLRKDHYENSLYRIPTGGIHHDETTLQTLQRELFEETGIREKLKTKLLGTIVYEISLPEEKVYFASYIFTIKFGDRTPVATDENEGISGFKKVAKSRVGQIAQSWANQENLKKKPYWSEWCQFRAILHQKVTELLK